MPPPFLNLLRSLPLIVAAWAGTAMAAPRVPLVDRSEYQAGLRAMQNLQHEVAALKFERLLKEPDLERAEASRVAGQMVEALVRARLPERAQVALTLFEVPDKLFWQGQTFLLQRKFREAEWSFGAYLHSGAKRHAGLAQMAYAQSIIGQGRENTGRKEMKLLQDHPDRALAERARLYSNESEALSGRASIVLKRLGNERGSPENEFVKACAFIEERNGKQAEILLRRILDAAEPPSKLLNDAANVRLAEAYALQPGRARTAERRLEQFLSQDVDSPCLEAAFALLRRLHEEHSTDDDDLLRNLLAWSAETQPPGRHALALYHTGLWFQDLGRTGEAIGFFEAFRMLYPGHHHVGPVLRTLMTLYGAQHADDRVLELAREWRTRFGTGGEDTLDFLTGMVRHARSEYAEAALLFEKSAAAPSDYAQALRATYNTAVSAMAAGDMARYGEALAQLRAPTAAVPEPVGEDETPKPAPRKETEDLAARLELERALQLASKRDSGAEAALQEFIKTHPAHPRLVEAHLAHAELCLLAVPTRTKAAGAALDAAMALPGLDAGWQERLDYTRVWWHEAAGNLEGVTAEAATYLARWPNSPRRDEVRMKAAQAHFRREEYTAAEAQFEALAEESADSPYAEVALFFAGRAAALQLTNEGIENAISLWEEVVARDGPLLREAQLQQAAAKRRQGREEDALLVIESLIGSLPPDKPEEKLRLFTEQGELLILLARKDPANLDEAVKIFRSILSDPAASGLWRARAEVLLAQAHRQAGRTGEALEACSDVVEQGLAAVAITRALTPQDYLWLYRAGFMALDLLESRKEWEAAARLADRLAAAGGERSEEARQRATRLRLEHFLWEK